MVRRPEATFPEAASALDVKVAWRHQVRASALAYPPPLVGHRCDQGLVWIQSVPDAALDAVPPEEAFPLAEDGQVLLVVMYGEAAAGMQDDGRRLGFERRLGLERVAAVASILARPRILGLVSARVRLAMHGFALVHGIRRRHLVRLLAATSLGEDEEGGLECFGGVQGVVVMVTPPTLVGHVGFSDLLKNPTSSFCVHGPEEVREVVVRPDLTQGADGQHTRDLLGGGKGRDKRTGGFATAWRGSGGASTL